ncbi:transcriptional pleiotropic regulator of transition state genes [Paenibacillaceae bacterium GAS479]|nr:transcriptional pleiotropic regulator of transition state genes [Paenibacillaceae bacterium GAS479]
MKSIGIVRLIDELGRIVLPIELRRMLELNEGDPVEFFMDEAAKRLVLRKFRSQECLFCQSTEALAFFKNRFICGSCLADVSTKENKAAVGFGSSVESRRDEMHPAAGVFAKPQVAATRMESFSQSNVERRAGGPAASLAAGFFSQQSKGEQTARRLAEVMQSHPRASQGEWARMLGISQGRVSQLLRTMK